MSRIADLADRSVLVVAGIGVAPALMIAIALPTMAGDFGSAETRWAAASAASALVLLAGRIVKARMIVKACERHRGLAAGLLVVGAPAPALALFWLPPVYLVSIAIVALALLSLAPRPDAGPDTTELRALSPAGTSSPSVGIGTAARRPDPAQRGKNR